MSIFNQQTKDLETQTFYIIEFILGKLYNSSQKHQNDCYIQSAAFQSGEL